MKLGLWGFSCTPKSRSSAEGKRVVFYITTMVPTWEVGEIPSILHLSGYSVKCSLADELEIVEEEGTAETCLL